MKIIRTIANIVGPKLEPVFKLIHSAIIASQLPSKTGALGAGSMVAGFAALLVDNGAASGESAFYFTLGVNLIALAGLLSFLAIGMAWVFEAQPGRKPTSIQRVDAIVRVMMDGMRYAVPSVLLVIPKFIVNKDEGAIAALAIFCALAFFSYGSLAFVRFTQMKAHQSAGNGN